MSKQEWLKHMKELPLEVGSHVRATCAICQARIKTRMRNQYAREQTEVYRSCGMKRVRGNLGGTYWE